MKSEFNLFLFCFQAQYLFIIFSVFVYLSRRYAPMNLIVSMQDDKNIFCFHDKNVLMAVKSRLNSLIAIFGHHGILRSKRHSNFLFRSSIIIKSGHHLAINCVFAERKLSVSVGLYCSLLIEIFKI